MRTPPANAELGNARSNEVRGARSVERANAIFRMFRFISYRYQPATYEDFVRVLNEIGYPTANGTGIWSVSMVQRYMHEFGSAPKDLLKEGPPKQGFVLDYRPEVFTTIGQILQRLLEPNETNGAYKQGGKHEPSGHSFIKHNELGEGSIVRRIGSGTRAKYTCRFSCCYQEPAAHEDHEMSAAEFMVFVFNESYWERHRLADEAAAEVLESEKPSWHHRKVG
jgi:hypothetical protein